MKIHHTLHLRPNAFTLMEMMVVLAIIAMLVSIGVVTLMNIEENARITAARAQLGTLKTAVMSYQTVNRKLPKQLEDLLHPPADAISKNVLVKEEGLVDPWGVKYQWRRPAKHSGEAYDLYSMGPNSIDGDIDDLYP
jgi:general secretion pathway protein G